MLAKFEKRAYVGSEKVWVGKYRNLLNISHWHMEHEMIVWMEGCAQECHFLSKWVCALHPYRS